MKRSSILTLFLALVLVLQSCAFPTTPNDGTDSEFPTESSHTQSESESESDSDYVAKRRRRK